MICNPTQINIKICNLQKYNITELILGGLQILIVTSVGLQIRHNREEISCVFTGFTSIQLVKSRSKTIFHYFGL